MKIETAKNPAIGLITCKRRRATVTALLAWAALLGAWDAASRADEAAISAAADTHEARVASILRRSSNPREIGYEAMHEGGGGRNGRCVLGQRMLDR